jgi:hypothetical protein
VTRQGGVVVTIIALCVVGYFYFFRKPVSQAAPAPTVTQTVTRYPVVLNSPLSGWEIIIIISVIAFVTLGVIAMHRYPRR